MPFHHTQLANGLTVIAETNPGAHTASVGFFVRAGTRDEPRELMGVSHFLEHMMFKGTARRSADDVNREFDELGANYNAFTSHDATVYFAQVLPEFLPRAVDLLGDMLRPALRDEDFDTEKKVIIEEIGMYDDRPAWRLQDTILERHFADHPLGFRVLGTEQSVRPLTPAQMRGYFDHRYGSDSITVAAAGRLDFDRFVKEVEATAGSWRSTCATRDYATPSFTPTQQTLVDAKVSRAYMALMCPGPTAQDDDRYAAKVLADLLGDSDGSRLYWALIDPGLADEADFAFTPQDRVGGYFGFASCDPERAGEVERIMLDTIDAGAEKIDPAEIERAKNKLATAAMIACESPSGRMSAVGDQWLYLGRYTPLQEQLDQLMAVTPDDVRRVAAKWLLGRRTIVRLRPG